MGRRANGTKPKKSRPSTRLPPLGKGPIKRTPRHEFDHRDHPDDVYDVEKILAERLVKNGDRTVEEWLIRWKGYTEADDTWEPIENLAGLEDDIAKFRNERDSQETIKLGKRRRKTQVNDHPVSIPAAASQGSGGKSNVSVSEIDLSDVEDNEDSNIQEILRPAMRGRRVAQVRCPVSALHVFVRYSIPTA